MYGNPSKRLWTNKGRAGVLQNQHIAVYVCVTHTQTYKYIYVERYTFIKLCKPCAKII